MAITHLTNYAVIESAIRTWVVTHTGFAGDKVIWLNQAAPRPAKPFATLQILQDGQPLAQEQEFHKYDADDERIDVIVHAPKKMTVQVQVYSGMQTQASDAVARRILLSVLAAARMPSQQDLFAAAGVAYIGHEPVQALDDQTGDRWERRAAADVHFTYEAATKDDGDATSGLQWIETVEPITEEDNTLDIQ